jgi:hypothetical protein
LLSESWWVVCREDDADFETLLSRTQDVKREGDSLYAAKRYTPEQKELACTHDRMSQLRDFFFFLLWVKFICRLSEAIAKYTDAMEVLSTAADVCEKSDEHKITIMQGFILMNLAACHEKLGE